EGLMRGLIGLVQPLFDLPRRQALAEAGGIRARIAADLLAEETAVRLAKAADDWCRWQELRRRQALEEDPIETATAELARAKERRRAGVGSDAEGLLAEHHRLAAEAGLADTRRRLDLHRAALRR